MKTVKISVASLVAKNSVVPNHKIEFASGKHPLSGLRRLRELKKEFKERYPKLTAYTYADNRYTFKKMFQVFCLRKLNKVEK